MPESGRQYLFNMQARGDWVRLRTLVMLRWIAIAGQIAAVLAASLNRLGSAVRRDSLA